ncbi:cdc42 effector protein 5 [Synchiropus picturatus]
MPLHKSSRAPRLDPTMISAPLGDFRHTMHIGRGGDAFGDTSFLSTLGPRPPSADLGGPAGPSSMESSVNHLQSEPLDITPNNESEHLESVSSLTLDLDLDLGPSMLGDVLGVMDGLSLQDDVFSTKNSVASEEAKQMGDTELSVSIQNGKNFDGSQMGDSRVPDVNGIKTKGLRPKVRFSDKREEIIRQASEEDEGQEFDFQDDDQMEHHSQGTTEVERGSGVVSRGETEFNRGDLPPSPASSHSSEYEGVTTLDRRLDSVQSETDTEDEEDEGVGRGYTFEDEFDDEIGL